MRCILFLLLLPSTAFAVSWRASDATAYGTLFGPSSTVMGTRFTGGLLDIELDPATGAVSFLGNFPDQLSFSFSDQAPDEPTSFDAETGVVRFSDLPMPGSVTVNGTSIVNQSIFLRPYLETRMRNGVLCLSPDIFWFGIPSGTSILEIGLSGDAPVVFSDDTAVRAQTVPEPPTAALMLVFIFLSTPLLRSCAKRNKPAITR